MELSITHEKELSELKEKLFEYMTLNPRMYSHFEEYTTDKVHPMTALRTSVSYLAHFDENADDNDEEALQERAIRIQAKIASLVASFARVREA